MKSLDDLLLYAINKEPPQITIEKQADIILEEEEKPWPDTPDWMLELLKGTKVGEERERHFYFYTNKKGEEAFNKAMDEHLKSEREA